MINAGTYNHSGDLEAHGRVDVFANLLESDIERLHILVTRHAKLTGSKKAVEILANWKAWLPKFRKVMPVEYRRALKELKANADAEPKIAIESPPVVPMRVQGTPAPFILASTRPASAAGTVTM